MKKIITISLLLISITLCAQLNQRPAGSLTILSDRGVRFKLYLNGELQNRNSKENVRAENLTRKVYTARIQFENTFLPVVTENNIVISGRNNLGGTEFYNVIYKIVVDRRNKTRLEYVSKQPVVQVPAVTPGIVIGIGDNRPPIQIVPPGTPNGNGGNRPPYEGGGRQPIYKYRCAGNRAVRGEDFQNIISMVNEETFSSDKEKLLNRIIADHCMSTSQISELIKTYFKFDDDRLNFAFRAYDYCVDPRNYYQLSSLLSFSSSKDKLYQYVDSKK